MLTSFYSMDSNDRAHISSFSGTVKILKVPAAYVGKKFGNTKCATENLFYERYAV